MLDNTVVNVALPSIQRDLGVGLSELEWIVTGYALTFAALMLIGGKRPPLPLGLWNDAQSHESAFLKDASAS